ncbi:hypothetical protein AURDEDRAFT_123741 [Auricularia subglabra TFB-10046 SS5]|nr:hypothetical protein AURDEDRAFT_123741 [Auricularia subglabra TFB-10046 SS5]
MPAKRAVPASSSSPAIDVSGPPQPAWPSQMMPTPSQSSGNIPPSPSGSLSRTPSPSSSISSFFRPAKWFQRTRTTSGRSQTLQVPEYQQPPARPPPTSYNSTGGLPRKPKISGPTDPRPIPASHGSASSSQLAGSRSVLDLSQTLNDPLPPSEGLGDLRAISKKKWSRSFDDLSRMISKPEQDASFGRIRTETAPLPSSENVLASQRAKIQAYRAGANAPRPPSPPGSSSPSMVSFPSLSPSTASPPKGTMLSPNMPLHSVSSVNLRRASDEQSPNRPRSRSFQALAPPSLQLNSAVRRGGGPASPASPGFGLTPKQSFPPRDKERKVNHAGSFGFSLPSFTKNSPTGERLPGDSPNSSNKESPEASVDPRRTSQIIHISGFLNRHPSITSAGAAPLSQNALAKGWKPFKVVVKGSKLLCYKPPGDRTNAIKELFPQGTVAAIEEEADEEPKSSPVESRARARRAYWGRAKHPELVLGADGSVHRGTAEALVHECVHATTAATGDEAWRLFASAVLLCLPLIVGREKFEGDFRRYAERMLGDGDAEQLAGLRQRVAWLVGRYLQHHFVPADPRQHANELKDWHEWCVGKDVGLLDESYPTLASRLLPSAATNGAIELSITEPSPATPVQPAWMQSPNVNVFSPRPPDMSKMPSVASAIAVSSASMATLPSGPLYTPTSPSKSTTTIAVNPAVWQSLATEGLTRDVVLEIPERAITNSLRVYFGGALGSVLGGASEDWVGDARQRLRSADVLFAGPAPKLRDFAGSENTPHWLTLHIMGQILSFGGGGMKSFSGSAGVSADLGKGVASRAEVVGRWVRVGEQAKAEGDECTWRAICAALCSRPVARLERLWRRVDPSIRRTVANWTSILSESDERVILGTQKKPAAAAKIPWVGDLPEQARNILESAKTGGAAKGDEWEVEMLLNVDRLVDQVVERFALCDAQVGSPAEGDVRLPDEDMARLIQLWEHTAAQPRPQLSSINHWMTLSVANEPKQRTRYAANFWLTNGPQAAQNILPLLFVEPLPAISFIDRAALNRIKKESIEGGSARPVFFENQIARTTQTGRTSADPRASNSSLSSMTVLPVFDGELVLLIQPGELSPGEGGLERKSSINHSMRVSTAGALERKSSMARRSSLPILSNSNRTSLLSTESSDPPLRAVVRAGTLDRLIDLLAFGLQGVTVGVADDNGEMPLREGGSRPLQVDRKAFASVWWYNFRAFVTPIVFFELLRKRYLSAVMPSQRVEVLETVEEWLKKGGGAQDALDNLDLWDGINTFLTAPAQRSGRASELMDKTAGDAEAAEELEETRRMCLGTFIKLTMRPRSKLSQPQQSGGGSKAKEGMFFGPHPPSIDEVSPEMFVDNLDAIAATMFKTVQPEDFFIAADYFETQGCDRTGWFNPYDPPTTYDTIEVEDIYKHLQDIPTSPLISEMSGATLDKMLPVGIRSVFRAHSYMRKWAILQIASPNLGLQKREQRMEFFLRAIEVCRVRSERPADETANANPIHHPCMRSFVETVLVSATLSIQSRTYHRAWQDIAAQRSVGVESLLSLTARSAPPQVARPKQKLTRDVGWVFERMLEILSMEDTTSAVSNPGPALVNFDKRRMLTDLITTTFASVPQRSSGRPDAEQVDVDRLNNMFREANAVELDIRSIRDTAYREAAQGGGHAANKKLARPFQSIMAIWLTIRSSAQQEKVKRDRYIRERLSKEKRMEQLRTDKREEDLNRAMQARKAAGPGTPKHHKGKKSMSALYKIMRPISTAFSSDNLFDGGRGLRRTPGELDFEPSGNPALVLSLVDARVSAFVNNQRSFTFFLDTEDGGRFLFQAMSKLDMNKWMAAINKTAQSAGRKRLTYIANSPKPQLADHLQVAAANPRDPVKVFGVELNFLLERENGSAELAPGTVPNIVSMLLGEIEARGLTEEGLYRVAGQRSVNDRIKELFNSGRPVDLQSDLFLDIFSLCDTVKTWFRELPGGLFPEDQYLQVIQTMRHPDFESRLESARNLVQSLPRPNFYLLRRVIEHLEKITDFEEQNHMNPENLAIVFGPNLIRAPSTNISTALSSMGQATLLTKMLIMNFHFIFDEAEPEADADADAELDIEEEESEGDGEGLEDVEEEDAEHELDSTTMNSRPTPVSSPSSHEERRKRRQSYFPELPPLELPALATLSAESILPPQHSS